MPDGGVGGDRDDDASDPQQDGKELAGEEGGGHDVGLEDGAQLGCGVAPQRFEPTRSEGAGIVDEEVQAAFTDPFHELGAVAGVGDVADDAFDLGHAPELLDDGAELLGTSSVEDESPALLGEGPGQRAAETERCSGHECGLHV